MLAKVLAAIAFGFLIFVSNAVGAQTLDETANYIIEKLKECSAPGYDQVSFDMSPSGVVEVHTKTTKSERVDSPIPVAQRDDWREISATMKEVKLRTIRFHPRQVEKFSAVSYNTFYISIRCDYRTDEFSVRDKCIQYKYVSTRTFDGGNRAMATAAVEHSEKYKHKNEDYVCAVEDRSAVCREQKKLSKISIDVCDMDTAERLSRAFTHLKKVVGTKEELF